MEQWLTRLQAGDPDAAWDAFLDRYRRLIFAAIRHYTREQDEVMDVFAHVCGALRADQLARLRRWSAHQEHRARFSTWLVAVVRNLTVDWFRMRDGRMRLSAAAAKLPPIRQRIFQYVFHESRTHLEAYELLRTRDRMEMRYGEYLRELHATYRQVGEGRPGSITRALFGPLPPVVDDSSAPPTLPTDAREEVAAALASLDDDVRVAVQLFVVEELPAAEVARIVGWPNAKSVYNRVYRALAALRENFARQGIGPGDL